MVPKKYTERGSGSEFSGITTQNHGKFVRPVGIFLGRVEILISICPLRPSVNSELRIPIPDFSWINLYSLLYLCIVCLGHNIGMYVANFFAYLRMDHAAKSGAIGA